jgi:hypothetical protein
MVPPYVSVLRASVAHIRSGSCYSFSAQRYLIQEGVVQYFFLIAGISFAYGDFGLFQIFTLALARKKEERRGLLLSVPATVGRVQSER